jgi:hypothetical protein
LKALEVESSKVIDRETFVPRGDLDPVYFDGSYYVYPDGPIAVETLRVIGAAMAEAGVVGLGRLTLSRRERMVVVEPRGTGMALSLCVRQRRFGRRSSALPRASCSLRPASRLRGIGGTESSQTLCWREVDSNPWSP